MIPRATWLGQPEAYETISVRFKANEYGILPVVFTTPLDRREFEIWITQVKAPDDMARWLLAIAQGDLPAVWDIEVESTDPVHYLVLADPLAGDRVNLQITAGKPSDGRTPPLFWAIVQRQHLVKQMLKAFRRFLGQGYRAEHWSITTDMRDTGVAEIMAALRRSTR